MKEAKSASELSASRRTPGRPPIPVEVIVATALQIVDEEGAEALTLRTLAQRLESGTATLYRHFVNRAELIDHVVDRVLGEVELDPADLRRTTWQEACLRGAGAVFSALSRHRNVAPLLVGQVPTGSNAMAHRERLIAVLLQNGFPPRLAAMAYATLAHFVLGFAMQFPSRRLDEPPHGRAVTLHVAPQSQFPATIAVAEFLPVSLEAEFAFGAELIVKGLDALLKDCE
jgi:AcrR family transcriptional regulator